MSMGVISSFVCHLSTTSICNFVFFLSYEMIYSQKAHKSYEGEKITLGNVRRTTKRTLTKQVVRVWPALAWCWVGSSG
jgi:hypothetical protein